MAGDSATDTLAGLRARVAGSGALPEPELIGLQREVVAVRRETDVLLALLAADMDRRSQSGPSGMARRRGFRTANQLIADALGGTIAEADRLRRLGEMLNDAPDDPADHAGGSSGEGGEDDAPGESGESGAGGEGAGGEGAAGAGGEGPGDAGPGDAGASGGDDARSRDRKRPVLPYLAAAGRRGWLSPDAIALLRDLLMRHPDARAASGLDVDPALRMTRLGRLPLADVERAAVDKARGLPLRSVRSLVKRLAADMTPPREAEENYERLRERRQAFTREEQDGMIHLTALLDPMTAAPLIAAMDGYVRKALRARRDNGPGDDRTPDQLRADALGWLGRHATGCREPHDAVKTTISIRMTLEDLRSGAGHGAVDGITGPVPVGVLRRHAADAAVIPTVLGGRSEVLDHGRAERLFTPAQRRAIAERDRGCAWCGAPPSHCDVHHIRFWENGGRTDLANGIMLCVACHHWIHRDAWAIRFREGRPEFVPPHGVDATGRARPGYRERTQLADEELTGHDRDEHAPAREGGPAHARARQPLAGASRAGPP